MLKGSTLKQVSRTVAPLNCGRSGEFSLPGMGPQSGSSYKDSSPSCLSLGPGLQASAELKPQPWPLLED